MGPQDAELGIQGSPGDIEESLGRGVGDTGYKAGDMGHKDVEMDTVSRTWDMGWGCRTGLGRGDTVLGTRDIGWGHGMQG